MIREHCQDRGCRIQGSTKAEPGRGRDAVERGRGGLGQILCHDAESARLYQQIGRAQGVLCIATAADPYQLR